MMAMRSDGPRLRLAIVGIIAVSLFAAMFARLWYLQVLASPEYQLQATALQQRVVIEPAPRGRILDRHGVVLVDNRLSWVVSLDRQRLADLEDDDRSELLTGLVAQLAPGEPTINVEVIEERLQSNRFSPYTPVPVADDVPEQLAVYFREHGEDFHNIVVVESRAVRQYRFGRLAAHVLGYVGPINDREFEANRDSPLEYQLSDEIGKEGVERSFERELRGIPGRRVLEVDAEGNVVRELEDFRRDPVAGNDVVLTIDHRMQAVAESALREELDRARGRRPSGDNPANAAPAGAVAVLDPRDGGVLALASYPDYDPSTLVDGIDNAEWATLSEESSHVPLLNRAIQGEYAPGSTFKLVTAYGALNSALTTPERVWNDEGVYRVPNCRGDSCVFRNAGSARHGSVDLREALEVSSDTYFYDIGARAWFGRGQVGDPIQDAAELFGMGSPTQVPLPGERAGRVMTPEEYAERHERQPDVFPDGEWQAGDNVNIAVGQGEMLVTPLQLANAYATLANGGTLFQPNIALEVRHPGTDEVERYEPRTVRQVPFAPGWREALLEGFVRVTTGGRGTATGTFSGFPNWTVAGKTGTAEVSGERADTALFVGFAPAEAPQYAAAAVLEESGFGGVAAAPLVRRILEPFAAGTLPDVVGGVPGFGYSVALPDQADPFAAGDVVD
jgi:penicillin-binding protein 2